MTDREPVQATIYDQDPMAQVREALDFYAARRSYRPILDRRPRRPCLCDRGKQARLALAALRIRDRSAVGRVPIVLTSIERVPS